MARRKTAPKRRQNFAAKSRRKSKKGLILPWPAIVFLLLCIGVLLLGWTFKTAAQDIHVTAKVSAPFLIEPAVITNPIDGQRFSSTPVAISGTCPEDSYINIFRNNIFSGSVVCSNKTFELSINLVPGANELKAQDYNMTDDPGPASTPITVYYDVPVPHPTPVPKPDQPTPHSPSSYPPFVLQTKFKLTGFEVGQTATWNLQVSGGLPPYGFTINWGDGQTSKVIKTSAGDLEISHKYLEAGDSGGYYTIKIYGTDSTGQKAYLQFFLLIKAKQGAPTSGTIVTNKPNNPFSGVSSQTLLMLAWPAYGIVVLMSMSYWLGEREELMVLKKKGRLRQRRA